MANPADNNLSGILSILPEQDITVYTNDGQGVYEECLIQNHYEKDRKTFQMGIASPSGFNGQSVAFVQLCSPTLLWICNWTLTRIGAPPVVPSPAPLVSDWILLDDWWDPNQMEVPGVDGQSLYYRIAGTFVYGHPNPAPNTNANIVYPLSPWIDTSKVTVDLRVVTNSSLTLGLIDAPGNIVPKLGQITTAGGGTSLGNITTTAGGASGKGIIQ